MTKPTHPHRLSKSRFVAGCQCHKLLWWRVHEPKAKELLNLSPRSRGAPSILI